MTPALKRELRRPAIEPTIGHMKSDGRLARCPLKANNGDALHAVLCGAGHNIRLILAHLRGLVAAYTRIILGVIAEILVAQQSPDAQVTPPA